ncbi:MAG TPA: hypothetical protein PK954_19750 [Anaerolineales bacterium]|nr:hypothetical protein [Anaerolineales bacterium]HRF48314.1 hypothetical protein [Anaerolineales bacterium]
MRTSLKGLLVMLLPIVSLACATFAPVVPDLVWDRSAEVEVISYACYGGLVPNEVWMNDIPTFRLWGDGRALWVEDQIDGSRRVYTAQFTDDEITAMLTEMAQRRFFTLADSYEPDYEIMDGGACQMRVALADTYKSVSVLTGGEPPADYDVLAGYLVRAGGHSGVDFVPERGFLFATPSGDPVSAATASWPADGIDGIRLAESAGGVPIEGEALRTAWEIVNRGIFTVVESGGESFRLAVQVEGVTSTWPVAP